MLSPLSPIIRGTVITFLFQKSFGLSIHRVIISSSKVIYWQALTIRSHVVPAAGKTTLPPPVCPAHWLTCPISPPPIRRLTRYPSLILPSRCASFFPHCPADDLVSPAGRLASPPAPACAASVSARSRPLQTAPQCSASRNRGPRQATTAVARHQRNCALSSASRCRRRVSCSTGCHRAASSPAPVLVAAAPLPTLIAFGTAPHPGYSDTRNQ